MKKSDFVLTVILIIFFVLLPFISFIFLENNDADCVIIKVDGNIVGTYSLSSDNEYVINNEYGYNLICVKDKEVYIKTSDCANNDCVKTGSIKNSVKSIVCLPHHLEVIIDSEAIIDTVAY